MPWKNSVELKSQQFRCGYCGSLIATVTGFLKQDQSGHIYICPHCDQPTYFDRSGTPTPGVPFGNYVEHLPAEIESLYAEARRCASVSAYTATVLLCRKLLMNIAVFLKAREGESFISYVEYLATNGYVPPNGQAWVDYIRKKGNEAAHEIVVMKPRDAEKIISFLEMLLKFIFEFPSKISAPQIDD